MINKLFKLAKHHIQSIISQGYAEVTLPSGETVIVSEEDLLFDMNELEEFVRKSKEH